MTITWKEDQPIYRQLKDQMIARIMDGSLNEGEALPSVRSVAVDYQINPLTASKAYQELASEEIVEKRRGLGMFVTEGARAKLLDSERRHFLTHEWPAILERIEQLGLQAEELVQKSPSTNMNGEHS
ncbi:MAG: GntR family transcriptional regulator [Pseudomonadota bacterium]